MDYFEVQGLLKGGDGTDMFVNSANKDTTMISVINQLDAQNVCFTISLFHSLHVPSTCAHHQVKIALHSLWYHHTERSEWSKVTKIQLCNFRSLTCFSGMI